MRKFTLKTNTFWKTIFLNFLYSIPLFTVCSSICGIAAPQKTSAPDDPTRPPYYQAKTTRIISQEDLKLTAIITSRDRRLAVVNDVIVKTGDKIGDITVIDIGKNFVKFHGASGFFTILLYSDVV